MAAPIALADESGSAWFDQPQGRYVTRLLQLARDTAQSEILEVELPRGLAVAPPEAQKLIGLYGFTPVAEARASPY